MNQLILYTSEDGKSRIQLRAEGGTVWLSQLEMAELFQTTKQNIAKHLKAIFADGKRYQTRYYNLDAILAVGYRVRSPRGVQFRRWASTVLAEYLRKGFVMDDERLKNPDGRPDYFDEMLERIRDIRASEKRFYQKVRDLFALSSDYDRSDAATQQFFAAVQNLLLYAVTQQTALRARRQTLTPMAFWRENVGQIIVANGFPLLSGAGSISHERMERKVGALFLDYDQRRKTREAQAADAQDEAELKALENRIKHRKGKSS